MLQQLLFAKTATSVFPAIELANSIKNTETINVTPDANPSNPSVKFTAFTIATIINIIIGIYNIPTFITKSVNGIISCEALDDDVY